MKKLFILPTILFAISVASHSVAQSVTPRFGITAGSNLTSIGRFESGNVSYNSDYVFGFKGGVFADLPFTSSFGLMPQVLYSQKGGKVSETVNGTTGQIKVRTSYIDVPVLLAFKPSPEITITAGPQMSFLLSQATDISVNNTASPTITDTQNFRKSIIGGNVGIGYNFNSMVSLNANYMFDFQPMANDNANQSKARNQGFGLSLGYSF